MRGSFIARLVVPIIACLWSHSLWAGPVSLSEAATLISRYPAGQLAETDSVRDALHVIGKEARVEKSGSYNKSYFWSRMPRNSLHCTQYEKYERAKLHNNGLRSEPRCRSGFKTTAP